MALQFPDNRYPGINAHLNSYMQQRNGTWSSFHAKFMNTLQETLDVALPPNYYAVTEYGLQISEIGDEKLRNRGTLPDVSVLQSYVRAIPALKFDLGITPTATIPLPETIKLEDEEDRLIRVGVYKSEPDDIRGKLVTIIEVLSPANKPATDYYPVYIEKRNNLLSSGVNIVEVDLLHESLPVIDNIPSYKDKEKNAYPYYIGISMPQPEFQLGQFILCGIAVDTPLPKIAIPLATNDIATLDFNLAYNAAFKGARLYSMLVDYEKLPVNFERYSATDQQRIKDILERIRKDLN
jgi:hypothetical protein